MARNNEYIAETLKKAIKGEEDGYTFYNLLMEKTSNPDAKRKLRNLRDDEVRHKQTLVDIFHRFIGPEIGPLPAKGITALADVFKRGRLEERKSEMEYINLAIEAELAATRYYQQERDMVDDADFREIFDSLAEEEHHHFELLQAERDAISGNYFWFGYDEASPLEH